MPDYAQGKLYRIISPNTDHVYIGSTTKTLDKRLQGHVSDSKHAKRPCTSELIIKAGDAIIELIELYPCASRKELEAREGEVQKTTDNCCNQKIAGERTPEEKVANNKAYYVANKEVLKENKRAYYAEHSEEIASSNKVYNAKNAVAISARAKDYYAKNRDAIREQQRQAYHKKKAEAEALKNIEPNL